MSALPAVVQVCSSADVQAAVLGNRRMPRGGASKPALSHAPADVTILEMAGLSGILEYEPGEYTFTALAGTPVAQVQAVLAANGQYLPFDPPLVEHGATLGGAVASGLSGSGRYRYGGVRDFIIGVRFVDGRGQLVRGGGKVVKNAAGFDFPKLMVGSLGRLGVLVEVSFKVFPQPAAYTTVQASYEKPDQALDALQRLMGASFDVDALDMEPASRVGECYTLWIRLGGLPDVLPERATRLCQFLGRGDIVSGADETALWQSVREFSWTPDGVSVVKVPVTPGRIAEMEQHVELRQARRRYCVGGNLAWIAWPGRMEELDSVLRQLTLAGLVVLGAVDKVQLGVYKGQLFAQRIKQALDPHGRFLDVYA